MGCEHRLDVHLALVSGRAARVIESRLRVVGGRSDRLFLSGQQQHDGYVRISGTPLYGFGGLGGVFTSRPGVSTWGVGRSDVFGRGTDNLLYHGYYENGWSGFLENFSGAITPDSDCVSRNTNLIDCVVRGPNNEALWLSWTGSSWTSYSSLGNVLRSGPTIARSAPTISMGWHGARIVISISAAGPTGSAVGCGTISAAMRV